MTDALDGVTGVTPANLSPEDAQALNTVTTDPKTASFSSINPALPETTQQTYANVLRYGLPGLGVGLLDTLGKSVGLLSDNTVQETLNKYSSGPDSFGDFYQRNRAPLRMGGEIIGIALPGMIGMKVLKSIRYAREAGQLGSLLKNSTAVDAILGNSTALAGMEANIAASSETAAGNFGVFSGRSFDIPAINKIKSGYYAARAVESARQTIAFEAAYKTMYGQSVLMNPADSTVYDQLKWGAAGIVGGAGIDFAIARYAVRGILQASALKGASKTVQEAFDLNSAKNVKDAIFRPGDRGIGITQFSSLASELKNTSTLANNATLTSNLAQDQTVISSVISNQIAEMARDLHPALPRISLKKSGTNVLTEQGQLAFRALEKNDTAFLYATKLANVPADKEGFYTGLKDLKQEADDALSVASSVAPARFPDVAQRLKFLTSAQADWQKVDAAANEVHYVIENDGRYSVFRNRAPNWLDDNSFADIKRVTYKDKFLTAQDNKAEQVTRSKLMAKGTNDLVLHDDFRAELPGAPSSEDFSALYAMGAKLIKDWKPVVGETTQQTFDLNEKMPWRQIEMTLALGDAQPQAKTLIKYHGDFTNEKDAQFFVQSQKYKEFADLMDRTERQPIGTVASLARRTGQLFDPSEIMQRLNLPETANFTPHPLLETFAQARLQGASTLEDVFAGPTKSLTDHPLDLLQANMKETAGITDPTTKVSFNGPLLKQNDIRPLFVAARSTPMIFRNDQMIAIMSQTQRDLRLSRLSEIDPQNAPLVSRITQTVAGLPAADEARAVQTLHEGILSGRGVIVPQDRINEQFPALKAAMMVSQFTDKIIDQHVSEMASNVLTPKITEVLLPKNKAHLFDFNRIEQSYRHGWDITGVKPAEDGKLRFVLNPKSDLNKKLWEKNFPNASFDEAGTETQYMPDMSLTARRASNTVDQPLDLRVSKPAAELAQAISGMSIQSGVENNALRFALGSAPIKIRDFHLPTPELSREGTWFVRNSAGNVVATYTGGTPVSNKQRAIEAATKLKELSNGEVHTAVPVDDVRREHSVFDDNFFDVIDYSDQLAKTGKAIGGGLARAEIDTGPETLKAMVRSLNQQFLNVGVRARAAMFEPELNYAKQAAAVTPKSVLGESNIFDRYQALLFSRSTQAATGTAPKVYGAIESTIDNAFSFLNAKYSELNAHTEESAQAARGLRGLLKKAISNDEFTQLQTHMGDWSPFKEAADFAESTYKETIPFSARSLIAKTSLTASTLAIRFLDAGSAINNLFGLVTNAPAVIYALRRLPTETKEQWVGRTAAWGTHYVEGVSTFSPMRAMATASKAFWSGELAEPMAQAAKQGLFVPEYAALAKVLSQPVDGYGSKFNSFVNGASWLADNSEVLSRKMAWAAGYKIAKDLHKFDDERNAFIFANNFVNDTIGNYSPKNKPGMFQGAIGMPLGAFQTFMFNFYRRLFGMIERGDKKAIVAQYAAQASIFGTKSVPGWWAFNSLFFTNDTGSDDVGTRLDRTFPPGVTDLLMHGTLSNIPKIFGLGGMSWYTRGGVDYTAPPPTLLTASKAPAIQFLTETYQGISATLGNFFSHEGFSVQQQEEILANFSTNRSVKAIMEMAANAKTDVRGDVVQNSTRDAAHVAAMMLGTRTELSQQLMETYNKDRSVQISQEAMRTALNDKTRAMIRGGEFTTEDFQAVIQDYTRSGGNPAYIGQWLRNTEATATTPKAVTRMEELSKSGKWLEFLNMLSAIQQQ